MICEGRGDVGRFQARLREVDRGDPVHAGVRLGVARDDGRPHPDHPDPIERLHFDERRSLPLRSHEGLLSRFHGPEDTIENQEC